jgi:hypothetical protein
MAWTAIRKHPKIYLKYLYSNLMIYFFHGMKDVNFHRIIKRRYFKSIKDSERYTNFIKNDPAGALRIYYKKSYMMTMSEAFTEAFLKENQQPKMLSNLKLVQGENRKRINLQSPFLSDIHRIYEKFHNLIFRNNIWVFIFIAVFLLSSFRLIQSRFHHKNAFIFFIMTFAGLLHGLIVSMSSFPVPRFTYTMEFVYYLSFFMLPVLFMPDHLSKIRNTPVEKIKDKSGND